MSSSTPSSDVPAAGLDATGEIGSSRLEEAEARLRELEAERDALRHRLDAERARDDRYRQLFDSSDQGFCIVEVIFDREGRAEDYRFVEANAAFEAQTGLRRAVGRTMRSLRPDHEEHWFEIYGNVARTGEPVRFDRPAAALGRWYNVCAFRVGEPQDRLVGILFNDVTEQRRTKLEHDALEARLHSDLAATRHLHELSTRLVEADELTAVLDEILEATIALQGARFGNIQLFDPSSQSLSIAVQRGFSPEFLEHFAVVDAFDDSACGRALRLRERSIIEDVESDRDYAPHREIARRAGYRAVQSTPIVGRDGSPIGMLSTHFGEPHRPSERDLHLTDLYLHVAAELITRTRQEEALREAKEAAERANAAKSQFLSTISHELRTPLNAIIGFTDLLRREIVDPVTDGQKEHLDRINASALHLVTIIDEILTYTRFEAGKEELRITAVDIAELVTDVIDMLRPQADIRGLSLRVSRAEQPIEVHTDSGKVRQILVNLVGNAVRYTERGSVTIELRSDSGWIEMRVRDTGVGIAPDRLQEIFEPFVQIESSHSREKGGTGLGLAICRRLVRVLGGDIEVDSEPGVGTTFTVRLPGGAPA